MKDEGREQRARRASRKSQEKQGKEEAYRRASSTSDNDVGMPDADEQEKARALLASLSQPLTTGGKEESDNEESSLLEMQSTSPLERTETDENPSLPTTTGNKDNVLPDADEEQPPPLVAATFAAATIVEATPVEEIVATRVIPEGAALSPPEDLTIHHVDVDSSEALDDTDSDEKMEERPPLYLFVLVILLLVGSFAGMAALYMLLAVPPRETGDDACSKAYFERLHRVELVRGISLIQYTTLSVMLFVIIRRYWEHWMNTCCEDPAIADEDENRKKNDVTKTPMLEQIALFFWELMVFLVLLVTRIFVGVNRLDETSVVEKACPDYMKNGPPPSINQVLFESIIMLMLVLSMFSTTVRYNYLTCSEDRIRRFSPFWKMFWKHIAAVVDIILLILSAVATFYILTGQLLQSWKDWDPTA